LKVAARFPIHNFWPILLAISFVHFLLLSISINEFGFAWQQWLIFPSLAISFYFSNKQYQKITKSPDDLCWNGDSWLMHKDNKFNGAFYLDIQPSSWISSQVCLLCFTCGEREYCWLFSRSLLGERMYSQLSYLAKQNLKSKMKVLL